MCVCVWEMYVVGGGEVGECVSMVCAETGDDAALSGYHGVSD